MARQAVSTPVGMFKCRDLLLENHFHRFFFLIIYSHEAAHHITRFINFVFVQSVTI